MLGMPENHSATTVRNYKGISCSLEIEAEITEANFTVLK
jgi:hypothetical protein